MIHFLAISLYKEFLKLVAEISGNFRAEQEARSCIRCGDRTRATHHLRQKKRALQEVEAKDNQYQRLLEMMHQLGQTRQNKQIMDAYRAGASAFKATLQRQGIQPEQVWLCCIDYRCCSASDRRGEEEI